jgi:hypothetical protein
LPVYETRRTRGVSAAEKKQRRRRRHFPSRGCSGESSTNAPFVPPSKSHHKFQFKLKLLLHSRINASEAPVKLRHFCGNDIRTLPWPPTWPKLFNYQGKINSHITNAIDKVGQSSCKMNISLRCILILLQIVTLASIINGATVNYAYRSFVNTGAFSPRMSKKFNFLLWHEIDARYNSIHIILSVLFQKKNFFRI